MRKILYAKPSITDLEIKYVTDAIKNGWGEHCYDYIKRLETSFGNYLGVKNTIPTSSCTGALHLAFATLGIKDGDEVIAPDITWIASIAPITYLKARPVFVDILPDSWCIDPDKIEAAITPKTKAILVVHLYGNLVEMDAVLDIARRYDLPVIEDAAEAIGSEYKGNKAGSMGDFGVFSFHGTKTMTTGEGGILVTNRRELFEEANILSDHGRDPQTKKMFWVDRIGYKYKMSNLQAALGCAQVERLDDLVDKKRDVFRWYLEYFRGIPDLQWNSEPKYTKNSFWMPTVILGNPHKVKRDNLIQKMIDFGIQVRPFFYPVTSLPMFLKEKKNKFAYELSYRGLNLPNYYCLEKSDIQFIFEVFNQSIQ